MGANALLGRYVVGEGSTAIDVVAPDRVEMFPVLFQELTSCGAGSVDTKTFFADRTSGGAGRLTI